MEVRASGVNADVDGEQVVLMAGMKLLRKAGTEERLELSLNALGITVPEEVYLKHVVNALLLQVRLAQEELGGLKKVREGQEENFTTLIRVGSLSVLCKEKGSGSLRLRSKGKGKGYGAAEEIGEVENGVLAITATQIKYSALHSGTRASLQQRVQATDGHPGEHKYEGMMGGDVTATATGLEALGQGLSAPLLLVGSLELAGMLVMASLAHPSGTDRAVRMTQLTTLHGHPLRGCQSEHEVPLPSAPAKFYINLAGTIKGLELLSGACVGATLQAVTPVLSRLSGSPDLDVEEPPPLQLWDRLRQIVHGSLAVKLPAFAYSHLLWEGDKPWASLRCVVSELELKHCLGRFDVALSRLMLSVPSVGPGGTMPCGYAEPESPGMASVFFGSTKGRGDSTDLDLMSESWNRATCKGAEESPINYPARMNQQEDEAFGSFGLRHAVALVSDATASLTCMWGSTDCPLSHHVEYGAWGSSTPTSGADPFCNFRATSLQADVSFTAKSCGLPDEQGLCEGMWLALDIDLLDWLLPGQSIIVEEEDEEDLNDSIFEQRELEELNESGAFSQDPTLGELIQSGGMELNVYMEKAAAALWRTGGGFMLGVTSVEIASSIGSCKEDKKQGQMLEMVFSPVELNLLNPALIASSLGESVGIFASLAKVKEGLTADDFVLSANVLGIRLGKRREDDMGATPPPSAAPMHRPSLLSRLLNDEEMGSQFSSSADRSLRLEEPKLLWTLSIRDAVLIFVSHLLQHFAPDTSTSQNPADGFKSPPTSPRDDDGAPFTPPPRGATGAATGVGTGRPAALSGSGVRTLFVNSPDSVVRANSWDSNDSPRTGSPDKASFHNSMNSMSESNGLLEWLHQKQKQLNRTGNSPGSPEGSPAPSPTGTPGSRRLGSPESGSRAEGGGGSPISILRTPGSPSRRGQLSKSISQSRFQHQRSRSVSPRRMKSPGSSPRLGSSLLQRIATQHGQALLEHNIDYELVISRPQLKLSSCLGTVILSADEAMVQARTYRQCVRGPGGLIGGRHPHRKKEIKAKLTEAEIFALPARNRSSHGQVLGQWVTPVTSKAPDGPGRASLSPPPTSGNWGYAVHGGLHRVAEPFTIKCRYVFFAPVPYAEVQHGSVKRLPVVPEPRLALAVPQVLLRLDSQQFYQVLDVVKNLLLVPPPPEACRSTKNGVKAAAASDRPLAEQKSSHTNLALKSHREMLKGAVEEVLGSREAGVGAAGGHQPRQLMRIEYYVGCVTWQLKMPPMPATGRDANAHAHQAADHIEVGFTGLSACHSYFVDVADPELVYQDVLMQVERMWTYNQNPGVSSPSSRAPTPTTTPAAGGVSGIPQEGGPGIVGSPRSPRSSASAAAGSASAGPNSMPVLEPQLPEEGPCQRCGQRFVIRENTMVSCLYHGNDDGDLGSYQKSGPIGKAWSCCGAVSESAPGCCKRPHMAKEMMVSVRVEGGLPVVVQGKLVSVFNHLEINMFPGAAYVLAMVMTRDLATQLQQYFNLEEPPDHAKDSPATLLGERGRMRSPNKTGSGLLGKSRKVRSPAGDAGDKPNGNKMDEDQALYFRYVRLGEINLKVSVTGFRLLRLESFMVAVSPFVRVGKLITWPRFMRKLVVHLAQSVTRQALMPKQRGMAEDLLKEEERLMTLTPEKSKDGKTANERRLSAMKAKLLGVKSSTGRKFK
ncbi:unnamed protein product [Chrysoparadoxa australica]